MSPPALLWRIATAGPGWRADDLSGTGSALNPGRWNSAGVAMVYASTSIALACLETLVHLSGDQPLPLQRWLVAISVQAEHWQNRCVLDPAALPGWDSRPPTTVSSAWGDRWQHSRSTLLAVVPSVIVPEEANVLINPLHPAAGSLVPTLQRRWRADDRLA